MKLRLHHSEPRISTHQNIYEECKEWAIDLPLHTATPLNVKQSFISHLFFCMMFHIFILILNRTPEAGLALRASEEARVLALYLRLVFN